MLVLTRKVGQAVRIASGIVVVVTRIEGRHVRLGIEAPRSTRILRSELVAAGTADGNGRIRTSRARTNNK